MNPVFLFSGQGAQKPGMGSDLLNVPEVATAVACASDVLGYDVAELMTSAPADKLNDTRFAQPAMCVLSVGIARALMARGITPSYVLGFSLGQVSALAVSGMLSDEETFAFVRERACLMAEAAASYPGVMSALLRADEESVAKLCETCAQGQVLVAANYNGPGQIVISGEVEAVERAEAAGLHPASVPRALLRRGPSTARLCSRRPTNLTSIWRTLHSPSRKSRLFATPTQNPCARPTRANIWFATLRIPCCSSKASRRLQTRVRTFLRKWVSAACCRTW